MVVGVETDLRRDEENLRSLEARGEEPVDYVEAKKMAMEVGAQGVLECSYNDWASVDHVVQKAIRMGLGSKLFFPQI